MQANSLRGREGRGKLSARSRSGQCVGVIKVNVMDETERDKEAALPGQPRDRALVEGTLQHGWPLQTRMAGKHLAWKQS